MDVSCKEGVLPSNNHLLPARKEASRDVVEMREWENVMMMGEIKDEHAKTMSKANAKNRRDDECFINSDDKKYSNF